MTAADRPREAAEARRMISGGERMRTCGDCVHYAVCCDWLKKQGKYLTSDEGLICADFADQAHWAELPCRIGDMAYAIRNYRGAYHVQQGVISDMFYSDEMQLVVVIRHIARGIVGRSVFLTREAAEAAIAAKYKQEVDRH